ncbi:uncharacterized protein VDAG_05098 [Verticillium dahliae VdLs.17]|uniref:DUF1275 domain-containing protein n=1 Tax=Verticillium dahliae (strain VdLs.17 / ATCC MYA-4575 / FGSC 10137) TaxID=498257 RepID=G2X4L6_VERDV|nr:uncharacterized protein VDAG_05098 [Verticillium dahliae VdLs.17]EGY23660.1 hypothetical protein VDAG_05098 [Verticillium dahliae VdLs.17]
MVTQHCFDPLRHDPRRRIVGQADSTWLTKETDSQAAIRFARFADSNFLWRRPNSSLLLGTSRDADAAASTTASRLKTHLTTSVSRKHTDLVLLACYIITGPPRQRATPIYIGLGLAAPRESTRWIKSSVSLAAFCLGSLVFSRFHRGFPARRRWVLAASFAAQLALLLAASLIISLGPRRRRRPADDLSWDVLAPIALVAFQSCGQAVTSRALERNALTSVVLTSIYTDLFGDARLFGADNGERNRRVAAPLLLLGGAVAGGLFAGSEIGIAGALWAAAVLKLVLVGAWLVWPAE